MKLYLVMYIRISDTEDRPDKPISFFTLKPPFLQISNAIQDLSPMPVSRTNHQIYGITHQATLQLKSSLARTYLCIRPNFLCLSVSHSFSSFINTSTCTVYIRIHTDMIVFLPMFSFIFFRGEREKAVLKGLY